MKASNEWDYYYCYWPRYRCLHGRLRIERLDGHGRRCMERLIWPSSSIWFSGIRLVEAFDYLTLLYLDDLGKGDSGMWERERIVISLYLFTPAGKSINEGERGGGRLRLQLQRSSNHAILPSEMRRRNDCEIVNKLMSRLLLFSEH